MVEALLQHLAGLLGALRRKPLALEDVAREPEKLGASDARANRGTDALEDLDAEALVLDKPRGWLTDAERPGHIRVAARVRILWIEIDYDRLAALDAAVARLVPYRCLLSVRDDNDVGCPHAGVGECA